MANKTYDNSYDIILRGYDVSLRPNMENPGFYIVTLKEKGSTVFEEDVPNQSPEGVEVGEDVLKDIAQAAIDMLESSRGTLGLGAGAEPPKSKAKAMKKIYSNRKRAYGISCGYHENWYQNLKGTPYEDQAYALLNNYIDTEYSADQGDGTVADLCAQISEVEYQLKKLDLERMKMQPVSTQIIIVQADKKKAWIGDADDIQAFLDKFVGCPLESEAVKTVKQYIELKEELNNAYDLQDDNWSALSDIDYQMEALSMEAVYSNVVEKVPTTGLEAFPQMAGDIAELMEGVEMDAPLVPTDPAMVLAKKRALEEVDPVEDRIIELGEEHEGLDIAEVEYPDNATWNNGDKVQLKKEVESRGWAGKNVFPKGTKGTIDDLYDKGNQIYLVALQDPNSGKLKLVKVPGKDLSKSKK